MSSFRRETAPGDMAALHIRRGRHFVGVAGEAGNEGRIQPRSLWALTTCNVHSLQRRRQG